MGMKMIRSAAVAGAMALGFLAFGSTAGQAQHVLGSQPGTTFKDTSSFHPPAGVRVGVIEFQDLMCPLCAHVFPIIHAAVEKYKIPLYEKDYPLPGHAVLGSFEAAVWARYLQDKVSMKMADDYRGTIFAGQAGIANKDDMQSATRRFFQTHGLQMPFVADPTGEFAREVSADKTLGERIGVGHTPTIIVCNQHEWIEVTDVSELYTAIDQVSAGAGAGPVASAKPAAKKPAAKKTAAQ